MRKKLSTYTAYRVSDNFPLRFNSKEEAFDAVEKLVGNRLFRKIFPQENTWLAGPGDGTTSYMIKQDSVII